MQRGECKMTASQPQAAGVSPLSAPGSPSQLSAKAVGSQRRNILVFKDLNSDLSQPYRRRLVSFRYLFLMHPCEHHRNEPAFIARSLWDYLWAADVKIML